jgi:hypothetical protein
MGSGQLPMPTQSRGHGTQDSFLSNTFLDHALGSPTRLLAARQPV